MDSIPQIPTRTHIKSLALLSQIALVQHGDHADIDLRKRNMDIVSGTRKNDQDCIKKDASPHCPHEETVRNKENKETKDKSMENEEKQMENDCLCVTDEETGESSEQSSNKDQDSDEDEEIQI